MKKNLLKTAFSIFSTAVIFLISYSCSKQQFSSSEEVNAVAVMPSTSLNTITNSDNPFKATVGAPIEVATGNEWIDNFNKSNRGQGKYYVIASKDLQTILSNTNCVGICLYFAIDDNKTAHILPVGIDGNGRAMKVKYINTQKGMIDWETAQKWIASDPSPIDARFFGKNTFTRMFSDPTCLNVRAIYALDGNKNPQLLLANASINYYGSTILSSTQLRYEDESAVCPPVCPISN